MNYLAHLELAQQANSNLLGNLLGDFVKGDPYRRYSQAIAEGIQLHRAVDSFTDQHPCVREAKGLFAAPNRRYALIALDMFWDHCLAKQWQTFHAQPLPEFLVRAEKAVSQSVVGEEQLPPRFLQVNQRLWREGWLSSYQEFDNVMFALERISMRSERLGLLVNTQDELAKHYVQLEALFADFYPDLGQFSQQKAHQIKLSSP